VAVSNYPGTTVEVTRGKLRLAGCDVEVVDTPGMYSLLPISEDEAVARRLLLDEKPKLVLHVVDAKNLQRMLPLTIQLLEAGLPLVLALNMMDESEDLGFTFDIDGLSRQLGIPVVATAGATGRGLADLQRILSRSASWAAEESHSSTSVTGTGSVPAAERLVEYGETLEQAIRDVTAAIGGAAGISARAASVLVLEEDKEILEIVADRVSAEGAERVREIVRDAKAQFGQPLSIAIAMRRQDVVNSIMDQTMNWPADIPLPRLDWLSRLLMHPLAGLPALVLVLYVGIYQFVGVFGAKTLVDLIENRLFGQHINPFLTHWICHFLPPLALPMRWPSCFPLWDSSSSCSPPWKTVATCRASPCSQIGSSSQSG
jgi:ferrous iron transport protein B